MKNLFCFGKMKAISICRCLFSILLLIHFCISCILGYVLSITTKVVPIPKEIMQTAVITEHNTFLGIIIGSVIFLFGFIFWKMICEIIYSLLKYLER